MLPLYVAIVSAGLAVMLMGVSGLFAQGKTSVNPLLFFLAGLATACSVVLAAQTMRSEMPPAHQVAVFGYPAAGKTTGIVGMFREVLAQRIEGVSVTISTTSTIERLNEQIAQLDSGRAVSPTSDQDTFAYRAYLHKGNRIFPRTFKVEIGDFPGDDSKKFARKTTRKRMPWFHNTSFFSWASSSNVIAFVVDLAPFLTTNRGSKEFVAEMKRAYSATWQALLISPGTSLREGRRRPVVLVFTKVDLIGRVRWTDPPPVVNAAIEASAYGDRVPECIELEEVALSELKARVESAFADLIAYLKGEAPELRVVYASPFATLKGKRVGMEELLRSLLPR
jgi:hypothetical protein